MAQHLVLAPHLLQAQVISFETFLVLILPQLHLRQLTNLAILLGGMFRVNDKTVGSDVTVGGAENASATGTPNAVNSNVTLQVEDGGTLVII